MAKLPAIQFYPGDWKKDPGVQALSFHDRGVWFEILMMMHESEQRGVLLLNGQPMPDTALARVLGLDKQSLSETLETIVGYGVASRDPVSGALVCRRMVRDEEIRQKRIKAGYSGGNPVLLNQKDNRADKQKPTTGVKQIPTPSSSSSSSSSDLRDPPTPLVQYGAHIRMTANEFSELCRVYGAALVQQELPDMDLWVDKADTPNARKYRRAEHNHYLFARTSWLKDKKLKGSTGAAPRNASAAERRAANADLALRQVLESETIYDTSRDSDNASHVPSILAHHGSAPAKRRDSGNG